MASGVRPGETATESVRRILRSEAKKAVQVLEDGWPVADDAIHDARKRVKRARAALRLVRDALGTKVYRRENRALRDAARPLSEIRDAKILVEAFDGLVRDFPRPREQAVARVRELLVDAQARTRRRVLRTKEDLAPVLSALRSIRGRADDWRAGSHGWSELGSGLARVHGAGRAAFAAVRHDATAENLHEWRKQVKYLWHQLEILEPLRPRPVGKRGRQLHELADELGNDHDLAVLRGRLSRGRAGFDRAAIDGIVKAIDRRRGQLQANAFVLGARIYAEGPKDFVARIERYWRKWRSRARQG